MTCLNTFLQQINFQEASLSHTDLIDSIREKNSLSYLDKIIHLIKQLFSSDKQSLTLKNRVITQDTTNLKQFGEQLRKSKIDTQDRVKSLSYHVNIDDSLLIGSDDPSKRFSNFTKTSNTPLPTVIPAVIRPNRIQRLVLFYVDHNQQTIRYFDPKGVSILDNQKEAISTNAKISLSVILNELHQENPNYTLEEAVIESNESSILVSSDNSKHTSEQACISYLQTLLS